MRVEFFHKKVVKMDSHDFYLSPMIGEGMVLKLGSGTILWGEDIPRSKIEVEFQGQFYAEDVNEEGSWKIELSNLEAGGPFVLKIKGSKVHIIHEVYVGFVFLLSGQSNMELPLSRVLDLFEEEVKGIHNPYIRQFAVPQAFHFSKKQEKIHGGTWKAATGDFVMSFSAAGYFCAAELYEKFKIPVGLIHAAVGGSHIEAWLSKDILLPMNRYRKILKDLEKDPLGLERKKREIQEEKIWYDYIEKEDEGKLEEKKWYESEMDLVDFTECQLPNRFSDLALYDFTGIVWFYREIWLTKEQAKSPDVLLRLGTIVDADDTYVNGTLVGQTGYYYPPRRYKLEKGILREGKNSIVIRVMSWKGKGRFIADMPYYLKLKDLTIDLCGTWYYKIGFQAENKKTDSVFPPSLPIALYNTMIWPIRQYTVNAVLFYQGESNTGKAEEYSELFIKMIDLWRNTFLQKNLPFVYVQLPNYIDPLLDESQEIELFISKWRRFQEVQEQLLDKVRNVAMIVAKDFGQDNELHPQNKKGIGQRLALAFRKLVLSEEGEEINNEMESGMVKISKEK